MIDSVFCVYKVIVELGVRGFYAGDIIKIRYTGPRM